MRAGEADAVDVLPLQGFTVAVTAARRREELANLLTRRGARVVEAPAIRIIPTSDDHLLRAATELCITAPPDVVVATTGIGFRGWLEAADGWGLGEPLRARLEKAELLVRGPKAKGAVRAAGLTESWSPESESTDEVLARLLDEGVRGRRVAVQLHGEPLPGMVEALERAGATVIQVPVYRWLPAEDLRPLIRLVEQLAGGLIDCVTFTSAPAAASMLAVATEHGLLDGLLAALRHRVLVACVGPVTAAALHRHGVPTVEPERFRLGALVRTVVEELPARAIRLDVAGSVLELRGHAAVRDGTLIELSGKQSAVLRALAAADGAVLSRSDLLASAWPSEAADGHAVEMTVARLRTALGPAASVIQTVVKRGYRLAQASPTTSSSVQ